MPNVSKPGAVNSPGLAERGISAGIGTLWPFFDRHGITRKKRPGTCSSRTVLTS